MKEKQQEKELRVKDNLTIIDADFIIFCTGYTKDGNEEKSLEETLEATDDFIRQILIATRGEYYIGCLTQGKCFRYKVNPQYKANRVYKTKLPFYAEIKEHMRAKWGFIFNEELEADDLCAIAKKQYANDYNIITASPDKDVLNLNGNNYDYKNHKFKLCYKEQEEHHFWASMIIGDAADGIKGIPGKGKVFAQSRLSIYVECEYAQIILRDYIDYFGEQKGIEEFYKNYKSLKIVDEWNGYKVHEPIKFSEVDEYKEEDN